MSHHHTERSKLLSGGTPRYAFDTNIIEERHRRIRQFQSCLCVIFSSAVIIAIVASTAYTLSDRGDDGNRNGTDTDALFILLAKSWPLPDAIVNETTCENQTEWNRAIEEGVRALNRKNEIEKGIETLPFDSPSYKHHRAFVTAPKARNLSDLGYIHENARRLFPADKSRVCIDAGKRTECGALYKYRSYDGSCNNLKRPHEFGVAYTAFRRSLPPQYADGVSEPRVGQDGAPLPSARTVSLKVHRPYRKDDDKFSVVLAVWGQFLDHDITATALTRGVNGTSISCCSDEGQERHHPECFPIKLDPFDPLVRQNVSCMEFVRSAPAPTPGATLCLGSREQMNQVSAFIDGSVIYGSDPEIVMNLRTMAGGKLEMLLTEDNRTLLPVSKDSNDGCNRRAENDKGRYCFLAGDGRANENLHLTSMHLIWARQHNLLAGQLAELNPHWTDERLFQESRKIVGAQMQHITYKEFLSILLGPDLMGRFDLHPQDHGYFTKYNESVDPSIANSFAAAAFRFAHSIIPGLMKFLAKDSSSPEFVQLHKMLFDPFRLYEPGELDRALLGAMETSIEANDPYFTEELKDKLFVDEKKSACGLDLVSLNIQRGRDHGLVGYNSWREHCGLRRVADFQQLHGDIDDESLRSIENVYRNIDDIDLYTGALSEKPLDGSILGPTATCLLLDQFVRIKYGDRFWYENPRWFTQKQLDEIRKISLARVICDNSDDLGDVRVQPFVMQKITPHNLPVPCASLPKPDLSVWMEVLPHVRMSTDALDVVTTP